jgi:CheY-specific phosphatase CheX
MIECNTIDIVAEAIARALETMAFLDAEPCEEHPSVPDIIITAEIGFSGPVNGTIRTASGIDFARVLAENIGGMDEVTEEECIDAMKELVNVTCGLVLPLLASTENDVFDMTVPHLTQHEDRMHWEDFITSENVTVLDVEGFPVATRLIISDNTP